MRYLKLLSMICCTAVGVLLSPSCASRPVDGKPEVTEVNVGVKMDGYTGPFQGTVVSDTNITTSGSESIDDLVRRVSIGDTWLEYAVDAGTTHRVHLPAEVTDALTAYLREYLQFCGRPDISLDDELRFLRVSRRYDRKILEVEIDAPGGRRPVSQTEADRLITFVSSTASTLCAARGR